ncbi:MAG: hypothetical protein IVW53_15780 [Chloroflexi bacterium]|nr:hypothetical protein [Chloroflexota bacterium]
MTSALEPTQQLMFSLIKIWEASGQTQRAFCQEKELAYHKFHYWYKKYREHFAPPSARTPFVSVTVKDDRDKRTVAGGILELVLPDGRRLLFNQPVEVGFLKALLS